MTADTQTPAATKLNLVRPPDAPTIYVEGISQMLVGFPNSRLILAGLQQRVDQGQKLEETHHVACELIVPTAALIEMAQGILQSLGRSKVQLQDAGAQWQQKVQEVLEGLTTVATAPAVSQ